MPNLLRKLAGTTRCLAQRPSRDEYCGINHDSIQAQGLAAWWPIWEPMAPGSQRAPQAMDYGPFGLHMTPSVNTVHVPDPMMGTCWWGNYKPASIGGVSSWMSHSRPYNNGVAGRDPVDFGALPQTTTLAQAYMATAWVKTGAPATTYQGGSPVDAYVYSFDRSDGFGFPGHALALIMRIPNGGASTANASASMFDNDSTGGVPFGVQSLQVVNDNQWHLITGLYIPIGFTAGSVYGTGLQYITVDGEVGFIGGNDDQSTNVAQPFGFSASQANMGSPNDAGHAANPAPRQYFGSDDDGISSPFIGYIGDHRLYSYDFLVNKNNYQDVVSLFLQQTRSMYHPETRWELYRASPNKRTHFLQASAGGGTVYNVDVTDNVVGVDGGVDTVTASFRAPADNLVSTDTVSRLAASFRIPSDTAVTSDTAARMAAAFRALTDSAKASDASASATASRRAASDTAVSTDAASRTSASLRAPSDNLKITDATATTSVLFRALSDLLRVTDTSATATASFRNLTDNLKVTDTSASASAFKRAVFDTADVVDSVARLAASFRKLSDNVVITDAATASLVTAGSHLLHIVDTLALADAAARSASAFRTAADNAAVADAAGRAVVWARASADTVAATDAVGRAVRTLLALTDNTVLTDAAARAAASLRTVADSGAVADAVGRAAVYYRTVTEVVSILDLATAVIALSALGIVRSSAWGIPDTATGWST